MKEKVCYKIFIAGFLALSLVLSVGMAIAGPSQAGANEILSNAPQLQDKEGNFNKAYLSDLTDWVSDRFYLRQELISLNNWLSAKAFGVSGNDKVLQGRDGWLFFTETLDNYTGINALSQRQLFAIAKNIELMQRACIAQGKAFAFMIAPNKNAVYPQQMKDFGLIAEKTDADKLMALLKDMEVNTVDLLAALQSQEELLYFAHDSHWNSKGAALGADCINAAFSVSSHYFEGDFSQTKLHSGDLYEMSFPAFSDTEQDFLYGGGLNFTYTTAMTKPDSIILQTAGNGEGRLLAYRDSFGNLLYPYLADSYASCYFSRSATYDLTREADYVLVEIVQRNLGNLIQTAPIAPSPMAEVTMPEESAGELFVYSQGKAPEGYRRIEGTLPQSPDDDACVYAACDGEIYEAFLLEDNGFVLYLPETGNLEGIAYPIGGELMMFTVTEK